MPLHNADIAAIFTEMADLLDLQEANPFRIRAYRNAARTVAELGQEVRAMLERGADLTRLPGIGADLAGKMREIVDSGKCRALESLRAELPSAVGELLHVPGLGPKRVRMLWHELQVQTAEQLARAARDGQVRELPGFGAQTEANILQAVEAHLSASRRVKLATAAQYANSLQAWLLAAPGVERILRAMDQRQFTLLAHPTGRVIESRAPYDVDMPRIIRHARQRGCFLELNAHPERLDLLDIHCMMAREEGVLVAINSDAHGRDDLAHLRLGIGQARRGWLSAADVLNTRPLPELRRLLAAARQ